MRRRLFVLTFIFRSTAFVARRRKKEPSKGRLEKRRRASETKAVIARRSRLIALHFEHNAIESLIFEIFFADQERDGADVAEHSLSTFDFLP